MTCTTCNCPVTSPWRNFDARGHVVNGCVDSSHTGQLVTPSASADWHNRPDARKIRRAAAFRK